MITYWCDYCDDPQDGEDQWEALTAMETHILIGCREMEPLERVAYLVRFTQSRWRSLVRDASVSGWDLPCGHVLPSSNDF